LIKNEEIVLFINNDERAIKELYYEHRDIFLNFGNKYKLEHSQLIDIYQDAFVILREQALKGKLYTIKSGLRTYLFGIGKNLIYNELKRTNKMIPIFKEELIHEEPIEAPPFKSIEQTLEQKLLQKHFKTLGEKCQQMLTMFYYRGLSITEIAKMAGYNNDAVVRSQKSRCLKMLKNHINSLKI